MEDLRSALIAWLRRQAQQQPLASITYADIARANQVSWQTVKRYLGDKRQFERYLIEAPRFPDTREKILQAAFQVFAEKGFSEGSLTAVARVAGLSKGAVYWHFANKQELVLCLLEERCQADLAQMPARLAQLREYADPVAGLHAWLCDSLVVLKSDRLWARLFIELLAQARDPVLQRRLQQLYQNLYVELEKIHRQMQLDGLLAPDLSPLLLSVFWCALFDGLGIAAALDVLPADMNALAQAIAQVTLAGSLPSAT